MVKFFMMISILYLPILSKQPAAENKYPIPMKGLNKILIKYGRVGHDNKFSFLIFRCTDRGLMGAPSDLPSWRCREST